MIVYLRTAALIRAAPPAVLLAWAHFVRPYTAGLELVALALAALVGIVGTATVQLTPKIKAIFAASYAAIGVVALPFVGLLAVCSTGDCL